MNSLLSYYRLPFADHYVVLSQNSGGITLLHSLDELEGRSGFVVAPFHVTKEAPIVLIEPETTTVCADFGPTEQTVAAIDWQEDRAAYHTDFELFHRLLAAGKMSKVVLSRTVTAQSADVATHAFLLFRRACLRYPRMFVALVALPGGEQWLTATPEVLLQGSNGNYSTMALAGTMRLEGDELRGEGETARWASKDIEEQRYVASYIGDRLKSLGIDYDEQGPRTVRAAHLVHLRSDFRFRLPAGVPVSRLLATLHPTPAVCGLPKQQALDLILRHEHCQRRYYSGFMGPLGSTDTHLYVTLRCMQVSASSCLTLYAGGGLLRESREEQEWQETEAKLDTMRHLLYNNV